MTLELHCCWGKSPFYLLDRRLGSSQSWYGAFEKQRNLLPLPEVRLQIIGDPAHSLFTILPELFGLLLSVRFSFRFNVGFLYLYSTQRNKLHTFLISPLQLEEKHTRESRCETAEVPKYLYFSSCISVRLAGLYRSHYLGLLVKKIMICI